MFPDIARAPQRRTPSVSAKALIPLAWDDLRALVDSCTSVVGRPLASSTAAIVIGATAAMNGL
jgi:hypothetical protein